MKIKWVFEVFKKRSLTDLGTAGRASRGSRASIRLRGKNQFTDKQEPEHASL